MTRRNGMRNEGEQQEGTGKGSSRRPYICGMSRRYMNIDGQVQQEEEEARDIREDRCRARKDEMSAMRYRKE